MKLEWIWQPDTGNFDTDADVSKEKYDIEDDDNGDIDGCVYDQKWRNIRCNV